MYPPAARTASCIPLHGIFFEGGSTRRHYAWCESESLQQELEAVTLHVRQPYPLLVPQVSRHAELMALLPPGQGVLWSDVPLARSGKRLLTACYREQVGRAFWNAFSFVYTPSAEVLPLVRQLMEYGPETWSRLAQAHDADSRELSPIFAISILDKGRQLAASWDAEGAWVMHFPAQGTPGTLLDGRVPEPWVEVLGSPQPPDPAPVASPHPPVNEPSQTETRENQLPRKSPRWRKGLMLVATVYVAAISCIGAGAFKQNSSMKEIILAFMCSVPLWFQPVEADVTSEKALADRIINNYSTWGTNKAYKNDLQELLQRDNKEAAGQMRRCIKYMLSEEKLADAQRLMERMVKIEAELWPSEVQRVQTLSPQELCAYILEHEWRSEQQRGDEFKYRLGLKTLLASESPDAVAACRECARGLLALQYHSEDKQSLERRVDELTALLEEKKKSTVEVLKKDLAAEKQNNVELERKKSELERKKSELETRLTDQGQQMSELKKQLAERERQVSAQETQLTEQAQQMSELEQQKNELEKQLEEKSQESRQTHSDMERLQKVIDQHWCFKIQKWCRDLSERKVCGMSVCWVAGGLVLLLVILIFAWRIRVALKS